MNAGGSFNTIQELVMQGLTPEQISDTLQISLEDVVKAIEVSFSAENHPGNLDELYAKYQTQAVKTLASIMKESENDSARVTACKVLLNRGGNFTDDITKRLSDRFAKMRDVVSRHNSHSSVNVVADSSEGTEVTLNLATD